MSSIKIIVAFHKAYPYSPAALFKNMHLGKALAKAELPFEGDNEGDNISVKNPFYCELTALYSVWKNGPNLADYIGLCHYRRYFFKNPIWWKYLGRIKKIEARFFFRWSNFNSHQKAFAKYLQSYDILLPHKVDLGQSIQIQYLANHPAEPWNEMMRVIEELYPQQYLAAKVFFETNTSLHGYHIFIMRKAIFSEYMHWLFSILELVEKRIVMPDDSYQKRAFGFLGERLLNLFVHLNSLRVKSIPYVMFKD
jgi:hypothetical protein